MNYKIKFQSKKAEALSGYVTKHLTLVTSTYADPDHTEVAFNNKWHAVGNALVFATTLLKEGERLTCFEGGKKDGEVAVVIADNVIEVIECDNRRCDYEDEEPEEEPEEEPAEKVIYTIAC